MSDVCPDGSPVEFSAEFTEAGVQALRVLLEAVPPEATPRSAQRAAQALNHSLSTRHGAVLDRCEAVADLFLPPHPQGFAMMHAMNLRPGAAPGFKVYLNPAADDSRSAADRVEAALDRLGLSVVWPSVLAYARRGFTLDRIVYLSLDLSAEPDAKVKVYFRHLDITAAELDATMALGPTHRKGLFPSFCGELTGVAGALSVQPPVSSLTFTGALDTPTAVTGYVPLWTYADHDHQTHDRLYSVLSGLGLPADRYSTLTRLLARRPLAAGRGLHTYASLRTDRGQPRVVVYWSPEMHGSNPAPRYRTAG
ncbi:tryptophan dimethylallyltransferase family protein [Streptomyces sp. NPDC002588]|uniref:tryptophan dimethylallyltransferase family protein n=1 Tax=Streptomyces sp. NPDC002588 TaxID=3154419 RepID=UPI00331C8F57